MEINLQDTVERISSDSSNGRIGIVISISTLTKRARVEWKPRKPNEFGIRKTMKTWVKFSSLKVINSPEPNGEATSPKQDVTTIRSTVKQKVFDGTLRDSLEKAYKITEKEVESLMNLAKSGKGLAHSNSTVFGTGEVRSSLENNGWTDDEIDYLFYRSKSYIHDRKDGK